MLLGYDNFRHLHTLGRGGSIARLRLTLRLESAAAIRHGRIHVRTTCHRISLLWRGTISSWAAEASSGRKAASTAASRAVVRGLVYTNRPAVEPECCDVSIEA
jgi:hypothetical protein